MKIYRISLFLILILLASLLMVACNLVDSDSENSSNSDSDSYPSSGQNVLASNTTRQDLQVAQLAATPTLVPLDVIEEVNAQDRVLINLYQRVNPSVVNIEITQRSSLSASIIDSSGSGFVYDTEGHIITNAHVVADAAEIMVTFSDGYLTTARVIGIDDYSDIAVIKVDIDSDHLIPVVMGDSSQLLVGQSVVAIGNPFGLQSSMTRGIISAVGRALPSAQLINQANQRFANPSIIQVDAPINPGNSGGPLLNYGGEVIGVNAAIRTESGIFEGVAFAIPVNTVKRVVPQLIENGVAYYPWLGILTFPNERGFSMAALADVLDLPVTNGVIIDEVTADSPADKAGLRGGDEIVDIRGEQLHLGGDIIVAINGVFIKDLDALLAYLVENTSPGDIVTFTILRDDETLDMEVKLGIRP